MKNKSKSVPNRGKSKIKFKTINYKIRPVTYRKGEHWWNIDWSKRPRDEYFNYFKRNLNDLKYQKIDGKEILVFQLMRNEFIKNEHDLIIKFFPLDKINPIYGYQIILSNNEKEKAFLIHELIGFQEETKKEFMKEQKEKWCMEVNGWNELRHLHSRDIEQMLTREGVLYKSICQLNLITQAGEQEVYERKLKEGEPMIKRGFEMTNKPTVYLDKHKKSICDIYHNAIVKENKKIAWHKALIIYNKNAKIIKIIKDVPEANEDGNDKLKNYSQEVNNWIPKLSEYYNKIYLPSLKPIN